jgi:hypothetical protein
MITAHLFPKGESHIADHWAAAAKYNAAGAFSIGFRSASGKSNAHGGQTFESALVHEVSLVIAPANSACIAKYSETPDAAPAKPATVKPQAAKPNPKATETAKRIPLIIMTGHEDAATRQAIETHNRKATEANKRYSLLPFLAD